MNKVLKPEGTMGSTVRVLLVEDSENDALLILQELRRGGFNSVSERVETGEAMKSALTSKEWDVIISDYALPRFSCTAALKLVKESGIDVPFIIVSGTIGEEAAVAAMKAGVHDYIMKDKLKRLVPAIERELREVQIRHERKQAEDRYRVLVESMQEGVLMVDNNDVIRYASNRFCEMFGYQPKEILGKVGYTFLVDHTDRSIIAEKNRRRLERKAEFYEMQALKKSGERFWASINASPVTDDHGQVVGSMATIMDITGRKRAEEEIRESQQRFHQIAENIQEIFWLTDPQKNTMLYISPAYESIWGRTCESLLASPVSWVEAIHADERERILQATMNKQAIGEYDEEYRIVRPDGTIRWIHDKAFPVRDAHDNVIRIAGVANDITERKQVEEALRKSEEQFRMISENVADMIAVLDLDGKRLYNSPSYKLLLDDQESLRGTDSFQEIHPEDREKIRRIFQETVKTGKGQRAEYRFLLKDGSVRHIESQESVIRDGYGNISRVVVVSRDVTEKKQIENQILRMQRIESLGTLAGGIAHDLNNVLSPILMGIEVLRRKITDDQSKRTFDALEVSAHRGADLVKQILTFARGTKGERIHVNFAWVVRDIEQLIRETFPRSIQIRTNIAPDLRGIEGDPTQIHQILMNLCVNARDAMPDGGTLTVACENVLVDDQYARMKLDAKPGAHVLLSVSDTGIGMAPEVAAKAFEPFFTTKEPGKGTGIGLSTVAVIVRNHGGFVNLYSEPGRGSTFKIYLPAIVSMGEKNPEIEAKAGWGGGKTVLIIDDDDSIREITKDTLTSYDYKVLDAADGTEALAIYAEHKSHIAVAVVDMMMPYMDGPATIRALRKLDPSLKIIASTGLHEGARDMSKLNVQAILEKPFTAAKMLQTMEEVLKNEDISP